MTNMTDEIFEESERCLETNGGGDGGSCIDRRICIHRERTHRDFETRTVIVSE